MGSHEIISCILTLYLCLKQRYPKTIYKDLRDIIVREYLRDDHGLEEFEMECFFLGKPHLMKRYMWLVGQKINSWFYFSIASEGGCVELLRLLLSDKRSHSTILGNNCIWRASYYGQVEAVRLLLEDGRADTVVMSNSSIYSASRSGHLEIVQLLLGDSRVRNGVNMEALIEGAHERVKEFLKNYSLEKEPEKKKLKTEDSIYFLCSFSCTRYLSA